MRVIYDAKDLEVGKEYYVRSIREGHHLSYLREPVVAEVTVSHGPNGHKALALNYHRSQPHWCHPGNDYFTGNLVAVGPRPQMTTEEFEGWVVAQEAVKATVSRYRFRDIQNDEIVP